MMGVKDVKASWHRFMTSVLDNDMPEPAPLPELPDEVAQARQDWLNAQNYYDSVTDKDLVDHAVYMMQAAEKKYVYLLKRARREGITYSPYDQPATEETEQKIPM